LPGNTRGEAGIKNSTDSRIGGNAQKTQDEKEDLDRAVLKLMKGSRWKDRSVHSQGTCGLKAAFLLQHTQTSKSKIDRALRRQALNGEEPMGTCFIIYNRVQISRFIHLCCAEWCPDPESFHQQNAVNQLADSQPSFQ
jgi:hypothetical protein